MTKSSFSLLLVTAFLSACGGDSSHPTIQITSPANGEVVANGNRDITVSGTGSDIGSVQVKLNGVALPASAVSVTATTFTAGLTLGNNLNSIEAVASHSGGSTSSSTVTVFYPFVTLTAFQRASVVIGQADFGQFDPNRSKVSGAAAAANTIALPFGRALVSGGKLYLPDTGNNRVLVYDSVPATSDALAGLVLGQLKFDASGAGTTAGQWDHPQGVAAGPDALLVAEASRVLVFDHTPTQSGEAANLVLGWESFADPALDGGCGEALVDGASGMFVANGKLLVADASNHRVLIWNSIPAASGRSADLALGQNGLGSDQCAKNAGVDAGQTTLSGPTDVWSDGTRVVVADSGNNRVLIWNTFPPQNGAPADVVLGQSTFATADPASTQTGLFTPSSLSSNGNQLFVADAGNNRILVWNTFPSEKGAPADVVLGQSDFTHNQPNDQDPQDFHSESQPTDQTLNGPNGVAVSGNQLFVTDTHNNRYLIFDGN